MNGKTIDCYLDDLRGISRRLRAMGSGASIIVLAEKEELAEKLDATIAKLSKETMPVQHQD